MSTVALDATMLVATDAHEGPVYLRHENALYFTSLPRPGAGVTIRRDAELAASGAAAVPATPRDATYLPADVVRARFATGGLLHDAAAYKVDAGRRTGPGEVEYHERVTDVMRVVSGTATVVTGGTMVSPRTVAPGEVRAASIDGGTPHALAEGDVLVVPAGVPHQFTAASDPFHYFVVKVATC